MVRKPNHKAVYKRQVFNLIVLFPLSGEALRALKEYEEKKTNK